VAANDVCLALICSFGASTTVGVTGSGIGTWTNKIEIANGANHRFTVAWMRAAGGESVPTFTADTDVAAQIIGFSGVTTTGDPFDTGAGAPSQQVDTSTVTTVTGPAITPSFPNVMLIFAGAQSTGNSGTPVYSSYSGTNPVFTEGMNVGFGGASINLGFFLAYGIKTDTTTTGARTASSTQNWVATGVLAALIPAGAAAGVAASRGFPRGLARGFNR